MKSLTEQLKEQRLAASKGCTAEHLEAINKQAHDGLGYYVDSRNNTCYGKVPTGITEDEAVELKGLSRQVYNLRSQIQGFKNCIAKPSDVVDEAVDVAVDGMIDAYNSLEKLLEHLLG